MSNLLPLNGLGNLLLGLGLLLLLVLGLLSLRTRNGALSPGLSKQLLKTHSWLLLLAGLLLGVGLGLNL